MQVERRRWPRIQLRNVRLAVSDRGLVATTLLVFVGACAFLMAQIFLEKSKIIDEGYREVSLVRDAFAASVDKTIADTDRAILSVLSLNIDHRLSTPQGRDVLHEILKGHALAAGAYHFTVLDKRGLAVASSVENEDLGANQFAPLDSAALENISPSKSYISERLIGVLGPAKGRRIIAIARAYLDATGNIAGFVFAAIPVESMASFLPPSTLGVRGAAGIFRSDALLLARFPDVPNVIGKTYKDFPLFTQHLPASPEGQIRYRSQTDGTDRVTAYKTIRDGQIIVYTGLSVDDLLASWREKAMGTIMVLLVLGVAIAVLTAYAVNSQRRRTRGAAITVSQLERLAAASVHIARLTDKTTVLEDASRVARELVPSHLSLIRLRATPLVTQKLSGKSHSEKYEASEEFEQRLYDFGIDQLVCEHNQPIRLTQSDIGTLPAWRKLEAVHGGHPFMRGCLAVPIVANDGSNLGVIQLLDRVSGEFTVKDEAICIQLAQLVSVAIENLGLIETTQEAHIAAVMALQSERTAHREIERILSSTSDGFVGLDDAWCVKYMNDQAEEILGQNKDSMIGRILWDLFPQARESESYPKLQKARARKVSVTYNVFGQIGKWLEIRAFPYDDGISVFFRDITEQRQAAQQLQQAQRMEAIGQLTGGIAHDFNNLLTVVVGNADNLLDIVDPKSEVHDGLDLIRLAGRRGTELTKRLLAFARRQSLEPTATDLNVLVTGIKGLVQRAVGEAIDISIPHCNDLWAVLVDPVQLESTLLNLSINARDAMPKGGKLTFEMANIDIDESDVTESGDLKAGQYVLLAVSDTGTGMTPEVLAKAFDPFFTTKEVGKGTGLGLSMVYGFVKQSGGHIKLYSELDHGTTVKIYLPRAQAGEAVTALKESSTADMPKGSEIILLVEDDDLVRAYTKSALESLGYKVVVANDGNEALAMTEAGMYPDLLFTDIVLPGGINGKELSNKLLAAGATDRTLFVSGYTENAIMHHGALEAGDLLLTKPFGKREMALKVRDALAGVRSGAAA